jgi:hypothetical protein
MLPDMPTKIRKALATRLMLALALLATTTQGGHLLQSRQSGAKFTLTVDAGLVMNSGDVRRIARQDFFILSRNLAEVGDVSKIAFEYDVQSLINKVVNGPTLVFPALLCSKDNESSTEYKPLCDRFTNSKVATIVTDFNGSAKASLSSGTYYVVGHAVVGANQAVWNVRVTVTGNQTVILDSRNALVVKSVSR